MTAPKHRGVERLATREAGVPRCPCKVPAAVDMSAKSHAKRRCLRKLAEHEGQMLRLFEQKGDKGGEVRTHLKTSQILEFPKGSD